MKGRLFGVGVGPGDPELMTYKAVRNDRKMSGNSSACEGQGTCGQLQNCGRNGR